MSDSIQVGNQLLRDTGDLPPPEILVHDDSLRDGEQTVGISFSPAEKFEIARRMVDAGVDSMNLGFPVVSEQEAEMVRTIVQEVRGKTSYSCLARARKEDIAAVEKAGVSTIAMFLGVSDPHLVAKHRIDPAEAKKQITEHVSMAKAHGLKIRFALEDSSRAPLERVKVLTTAALEAGADMVVFCDTCGILTPITTDRVVRQLVALGGQDSISIHFHDDLGMATANALTAVAAGARMVQGTVVGIGERAGNTRLEEFVVAARVKYGLAAGIDIQRLLSAARYVRELIGWPLPPNSPINGANVFAHESGIHVHGLRRDPATYEPFPPAVVGAEHAFRFGKHAGVSNIEYVAEKAGLSVDKGAINAVLEEVKALGQRGVAVSEDHVRALLQVAAGRAS